MLAPSQPGIEKKPDYLVCRDAIEIVCEVKEFKTRAITEHLEKMGGAAFLPEKLVYGPVRAKIDDAAPQLKPLVGRGLPLVVVLSNPHRADVHMDPEDIALAMYGNPAYTITVGPEGAVGEGTYFAGRDGELTGHHPYISAVVTLHERGLDQDWADAEVKRYEHPYEFLRAASTAERGGSRPYWDSPLRPRVPHGQRHARNRRRPAGVRLQRPGRPRLVGHGRRRVLAGSLRPAGRG